MATEDTELRFKFTADSTKVKNAIKEEEASVKKSVKRTNADRIRARKRQLIESIRQVKTNAKVEERILQGQFRKRLISERNLAKQVLAIQKRSRQEIQKIQGIGPKGGGLFGGGLAGGLGKAGALAGVAFATKQIINFGSSALRTAADLELFDRRARIVFGDSLPKVAAAAEESAASIGLTRAEFTAAASAAGDLLKPIGFTASQAADSSIEFLNLAGALKEFNADSRSVNEINRIVTKSLLGERDALTSFGIKISEAEIQTRLLQKGQKGLTGQALILAKATATQTLLFEKSKDALTSFNEQGFKPLSRTLNEIQAGFGTATETLSTFIGRGLTPLAELLNSAIGTFNRFLEVLSGLSDSAATITVLTSAVAALGVALSIAFGPVGLVIAGIAAGLAALTIGLDQFNDTQEKTNKLIFAETRNFQKLAKQVDSLRKTRNKTIAQNKKLGEGIAELTNLAKKLNIELLTEEGTRKSINQLTKESIEAQRVQFQIELTKAVEEQVILTKQIADLEEKIKEDKAQGQAITFTEGLVKGAQERKEQAARDQARLEAILAVAKPVRVGGAPRGITRDVKKNAQQERFETIATFKLRQEQIEKNTEIELTAIDDRLFKELDAIETKEEKQVEAAKGSATKIAEIQAKFDKQRERAFERSRATRLEAEIKGFKQQRASIESSLAQVTTGKGLQSLIGGELRSGGFGGLAEGLGIAGAIPGVISNIKNLFGGISGFFDNILDNTEELARQEEERAKQVERTTRLIEQEVAFQKKLIELQGQRDALISKEAQTQIKLNRILFKDEGQRAKADLQVLKQQEVESRAAFGFQDKSAQDIANLIGEAEQTKVGNATAVAVANRVLERIQTGEFTTVGIQDISGDIVRINDAIGLGVSPGIRRFLEATKEKLIKANDLFVQEEFVREEFKSDLLGDIRDKKRQELIQQSLNLKAALKSEITRAGVFSAGQERDLTNALSLLDILGTVTEAERGIEGAAADTGFELTKARERSFIDIGRGGVREAFGVFRAPTVQPQALDLPAGVASVSLAQQATRSFAERQALSLETVADILDEQLLILIAIEENTRNAVGGNVNTIDNQLTVADILDAIAERAIA